MNRYDFKNIEPKWQQAWEDAEVFKASDDTSLPKYYLMIEFPYPSGAGLHVGHPRSYTALDIMARKRRMEGYNVLFPIGWDAFGLPAENYAIKTNIHPAIVTKQNIDRYRDQLKSIGFSFDYSREVDTTDPAYYKWSQWIFLKFFEHGLAYKAEIPINYCTSCKVGLANEEVVNNVCERCGNPVIKKVKSQWMLKITAYAQKLLDGLDNVDFISRVKTQQRNWIGRSEGAEVDFKLDGHDYNIRVFTTRPDTLYGATYMVVSPEHPIIDKFSNDIVNMNEVTAYRTEAAGKSDFERTELSHDKTGVRLIGLDAINPVTNEKIPVFISDYVMMGYGTGAIMSVPGHDQRDWDFAKAFDLPIIEVVSGGNIIEGAYTDNQNGVLINSDMINGLKVPEAKKKITAWLQEQKLGEPTVNYKLRDWVFSRQRYWGEPIPLVYCDECGWVPLPFEELPLTLPEVEDFKAGEDGQSPLAAMDEWVNTTCPKCGGAAKRETDTMPQWAGSSWYFLRYIDPHNDDEMAAMEKMKYWLPVDWYNGGMEHTTLHLLYSRFWHLFLHDIGIVPTPEPYQKRTSHGMILGENGEKMSKSRGNVINPDDMIELYGADAFRTYEMFMGAFDQPIPWSTNGVVGCKRFLDRVWRFCEMATDDMDYSAELTSNMHKTIKKVSEDFEAMKYNTAIAAMMTLVNDIYANGSITKGEFKTFLTLLYPVAPHVCEEMWQIMAYENMVCQAAWPTYDPELTIDDMVEIAVQINGKVRHRITIKAASTRDEMTEIAKSDESILALTQGKTVRKIIAIPGRLINIVAN